MSALRLAVLFALTVVILGCAVHVRDEVVTTDNRATVSDRVRNDSELSDDDKRLFLAGAWQRQSYIPYGKTVAQIIGDEQKAHDEDIAAEVVREQAAADKERRLKGDVALSLVSISVKRGSNDYGGAHVYDAPYEDMDTLAFVAQNRSDRAVKAFAADVEVTTKGGGQIFRGEVSAVDPLGRGLSSTIRVAHKPTLYPDEVTNARNTPTDQAIIRYSMTHIWYADGSELSAR